MILVIFTSLIERQGREMKEEREMMTGARKKDGKEYSVQGKEKKCTEFIGEVSLNFKLTSH